MEIRINQDTKKREIKLAPEGLLAIWITISEKEYEERKYKLVESEGNHGYGYFKTIPDKICIQLPLSTNQLIVLVEKDTFMVSTQLSYFKNFISKVGGWTLFDSKFLSACGDKIKLLENGYYSFEKSTRQDEKFFERFTNNVLNGAHHHIWDKQKGKYVINAEAYTKFNNPIPSVSETRKCYSYNGEEFYSYDTRLL